MIAVQQKDVTLLTSAQLKDSLDSCNGVIIPIASVEQCGSHGAEGIDVHVARYVSEKLANECDMLFAPVIPYGDTLEMEDFPGTVNVPDDVLSSFYYAVALSFFKAGAGNVLFLASHSLNIRAADKASRRLYSEGHNAVIADFWKACSQVSKGIIADAEYGTGHGAEQISSVSMAVNPSLIKKELSSNEKPLESLKSRVMHIYGGGNAVTSYSNFHDYSKSGSWGDISMASEEKGKVIIEKAVSLIAASVIEVFV